MRILVDMDDTIENLLDAWIKWLNKKHNTNVNPTDITDWRVAMFFPTLTKEQVFEPLYLSRFWQTVLPKVDAQDYLHRLLLEKHDIYIVTASHPYTVKYKYKYIIERYFPFIDSAHFITCNDKHLIVGDILVDDGPHNFGGNYIPILFSAAHNQQFAAQYRANNWKEVYELVHQIENKFPDMGVKQ